MFASSRTPADLLAAFASELQLRPPRRANETAGAPRHLIESDHGDARCSQAPRRGNEHGAPVHRPDDIDELSRPVIIDCVQRESRDVVSDNRAEGSIASSQLDEHAIARLEAGLPHAVQLPPVIGLPPIDENIDHRNREPLFDPGPPPSSEEENGLWLTPQQLTMRARLNLYAIAPRAVDEEIHHYSGGQDYVPMPLLTRARRIVRRSAIIFLVVGAIATPPAYFWELRT
jgi:hypothetical protein